MSRSASCLLMFASPSTTRGALSTDLPAKQTRCWRTPSGRTSWWLRLTCLSWSVSASCSQRAMPLNVCPSRCGGSMLPAPRGARHCFSTISKSRRCCMGLVAMRAPRRVQRGHIPGCTLCRAIWCAGVRASTGDAPMFGETLNAASSLAEPWFSMPGRPCTKTGVLTHRHKVGCCWPMPKVCAWRPSRLDWRHRHSKDVTHGFPYSTAHQGPAGAHG